MFKPVSVGNICSSPMLGPFLWPPCVYCRALSSHAPSIKAPSIVAYLTYKRNLFFTASGSGWIVQVPNRSAPCPFRGETGDTGRAFYHPFCTSVWDVFESSHTGGAQGFPVFPFLLSSRNARVEKQK